MYTRLKKACNATCKHITDNQILERDIITTSVNKLKRSLFIRAAPVLTAPPITNVAPSLYLGNLHDALNAPLLRKKGITHVVSIVSQSDAPDLREFYARNTQIAHKLFDADDSRTFMLCLYFYPALHYICEAIRKGGVVLVHCVAGASRSATIVAAYIAMMTRYTLERILLDMSKARRVVSPNIGFLQQLEIFVFMYRHVYDA